MKYLIFVNIKRWLIEYGIEFLDTFMVIENPDTLDTVVRYKDFMHEFNRHISSQNYYLSNFYSHLPFLSIVIHDLGYSSACYREYMIDFKYSWQTISTEIEGNCENTPEAHYETEDFVGNFLNNMMQSRTIKSGLVVNRNVFKDLHHLPNFKEKIYNVTSIEEYPTLFFGVEDETNTIQKQFKITIGEC